MVSHLLRVRCRADYERRSGVAALYGDGRILSERSAAYMDRLVLPASTALVPCFNSIRDDRARVGFGVVVIFAPPLAHSVFLYCDPVGTGRYFHGELHFFELPSADVGHLAAG